jgi:hypothetical protein
MNALPKAGTLAPPDKTGDVLLGEDWVSHDAMGETALRAGRRKRRIVSLNRSPLARKIIIFNLMALVVLVAGVLFFNPFRDSLVLQREQGLVTEAQMISQIFEASLSGDEALSATSLRVTRTPHREYDRTVGEAADSVGLRLTVEVAGLIYREQDVDAAAALVVAAQLPAGSAAVPGSLEWSPAASAPPSPELLTARVRQLWFQPVAVDAVQRAVRGRRPAEAAANLASLPGQAQPAEVKLAPAWWPVVPWLDVRTRVVTPWEQQ